MAHKTVYQSGQRLVRRGFSLIEAVIGMMVLSIVGFSLVSAILTSTHLAESTLRRQSAEVFTYGVLESLLIQTVNDLSQPTIRVRLPGATTDTVFADVDKSTAGWVTTSYDLRQRQDDPNMQSVPIALRLQITNNTLSASRPHLRLHLQYRWPRVTIGPNSTNQDEWLSGDTMIVRSLITNNRE